MPTRISDIPTYYLLREAPIVHRRANISPTPAHIQSANSVDAELRRRGYKDLAYDPTQPVPVYEETGERVPMPPRNLINAVVRLKSDGTFESIGGRRRRRSRRRRRT